MKRLTLSYRGNNVVSDIFNFHAYRLMYARFADAARIDGTVLDSAALDAVVAMFDGTALTEDVLLHSMEVDADELISACGRVLQWYMSVKAKPGNAPLVGKAPDNPILNIYRHLFLDRGILPGDIDKQDPQLIFDVMAAEDSGAVSADRIPDNLKYFYGL